MVDHLLRLKLALLLSAFRPGVTLVRTIAVLILATGVASALVWLAGEVDVGRADHRAALVVIASALAVGIAVAPLSAGLGSAMEPRRFASFPIEPRRLTLGLGLAAAMGVPGLLAALVGMSLERAWAQHPSAPAAVVAGVLAAIAIVITSQYLVVIGAQLDVSTAARRAITLVARTVISLSLVVSALTVLAVQSGDVAAVKSAAQLLALTPVGMLWAAPAAPLPGMLATLLGGIIMVAVLALGWGRVVSTVIASPVRTRAESRVRSLGWFDLAPATPAGVIAARSLLYWTTDARYRVALIGLPVAPILMMLAFAVAGAPLPPLWLVPLPVLALFLGWFAHNDVAYDHTAMWLHVAAPVPGAADRWGRVVPPLLLGVPTVLALAPVFALWSGVDGVLPALIGLSLGLLLTGLGVSCVSSAISAYPTARPGDGAFAQPPTTGTRAGWTQALSLTTILALMAPSALVASWGFADEQWFMTAALAGLGTGVGALVFGVAVGGRAFRRRAPELLGLVMRG